MKKIIKTIIFIIIILFAILKIRDIIIKNIYSLDYAELVYKYSEENKVDPMLVFAVIKAESNFKSDAVSRSDAIGLMQLMENTAIEVSKEYEEDFSKNMLYNPEINIKLGTKYLSYLLNKYDGNINLSLAAYNAGLGNVEEWIKDGVIESDGSNIENIPFKETNHYVRKILRDYEIYKEIYVM